MSDLVLLSRGSLKLHACGGAFYLTIDDKKCSQNFVSFSAAFLYMHANHAAICLERKGVAGELS